MIKTKKKILSFFSILIFAFCISAGLAQPTLYKIEINPLNRALLYFDKLPADYISKLSLDKKKITISVQNCRIIDSAKRAKGTGIIQDIYANLNRNQAVINIFLKDKRGYTAVPLPYSQALMIECFQWDNLSPGEDVYREALLAIEDKIYIGLQDSLLKAASLGESNSLTFLSFILLQKGYLKSSQKALAIASESGSKIPDLYAALSQTYKLLGDEKKTNDLNTLFYNATGLLSFNEIAIPNDLSSVHIADDSLFQILSNLSIASATKSQSDSLNLFSESDSAKTEIDTNNVLSKAKEESGSSWISDFLLYFIILFFLMAIFVISSYMKWRKQQLAQRKKIENKKTQFAQDFEKAKKTKSQGVLVDKTISENANPIKEKAPEKSKQAQEINLEDKLEKIVQKLVESKKQSMLTSDDFSEIETISTIKENEKEKIPPKVELALHLLKEQQRLKQQSIASLKKESLANREKLIDVAKKLKLEKSSVETQQKLEELKKDQQSFSKLKDKFSV